MSKRGYAVTDWQFLRSVIILWIFIAINAKNYSNVSRKQGISPFMILSVISDLPLEIMEFSNELFIKFAQN